MEYPKIKPCPFCGNTDLKTWWDWDPPGYKKYREGFNIECCIAHAFSTFKGDAIKKWNTRHEEKPRRRVMVVGDDHDRIPLIEAINQIGFDGIIIAEEASQVSLGIDVCRFEIPEPCTSERFMDRETNAQRCGYSTKRK